MKGQPHAFLIHAQRGSILDRQHMAASNLGAGALPRCRYHLAGRDLRIVQKARDPHLPGTIAAKLTDADPPAAITNQRSIQKGAPFFSRSSPNCPSVSSIVSSHRQITPRQGVSSQQPPQDPPRSVNVVARKRGREGWGKGKRERAP